MTPERYHENQVLLATMAAMLMRIPLKEMIGAAEHAGSIGPYVNPTLWIRNGKKLEQDIEVFRAWRSVQALIEQHTPPEVMALLAGEAGE